MIVQGFIDLIEQHADTLTRELMEEFRIRKETQTYSALADDVLYERIRKVLHNVTVRLTSWLSKTKPKDTLFAYYRELGRVRCREGMPLDEVIMVLMLIKRRIWKFIIENKQFAPAYRLDELLELNYAVSLFFDRVVLACITGYQEEMRQPA